ncbi:protein unc-13 homolog B-like isoform X2 [Aquarana catesbeiana]|uniref:protein unc-13 homolog B-like isoform X2 n=1 Tax=Aquarana catesbeiana TaxID=8400 RepID=UPI003CC94864
MVLLCVKVKRGRFNQFSGTASTYVIIKVHNLQSVTVPRPGSEPCWEQDYSFDLSDIQSGLLVQVWKSGWIWDSVLGNVWIPLQSIKHATDEGSGEWWTLHSEVETNGSEVCGIRSPTSHEILLDLFFAESYELQPHNCKELPPCFTTLQHFGKQNASWYSQIFQILTHQSRAPAAIISAPRFLCFHA